jgi:PAS domain S-box-containing protein
MSPDQHLARLAAIVTDSDDAIVSKNLQGIVQTWNLGAERIFGFTAEEMVGQPILRIIPPELHSEEHDILAKLQRGEKVDHFQTVRVRKDGRRLNISVTISPIRDATGKVVGASKIARDITEQVRSQRERERLYELGQAMAAEPDVHALVQKITDAATELSGAQFGAFFYNVINEKGEAYMLYTLSGVSREHFATFPMPRNTAVFGPTFAGEGIVRSEDITRDPRYAQNPPFHGMPKGHLPVRSYLAVPVRGRRGDVIGGLFFGHAMPGMFDARAEAIVGAVAGNAGVALDNNRLQRELQENAARERAARAAAERSAEETRAVTARLAQQYRLFDAALSAARDYIFILTLDGRFTYANNALLELWGLAADEAFGKSLAELKYPSEVEAQLMANLRRVVESRLPVTDATEYRSPSGTLGYYEYILAPVFDEGDRVVSVGGTSRDITARRQEEIERQQLLESERAARSEAERASRLKDEFLATLSHELRTPLNAILGWAQLLRRGGGDETLMEGLDVIERNAKVQTQLIEDLLDMSRIISGKIRLDVQRVDLAAVVDAAVEAVRPSASLKGLQIRKLLDPLAGPVMGDPNRLQQVVWNLLTNAIKFTPKLGRIEVILERINSHVEIHVSDTGQGIKPEFLPHVFERFRQADGSTTRRHGGLGLGLSIVKSLVELHGGKVRVTSAGEGLGSTFTITLPLAVVKHEGPREHPTTPRLMSGDCDSLSLQGLKVLVVDDEPDARELVKRLLEECHAQVFTAASAAEGLAVLSRERPDVLLSDIGMPGTDGYAFMRQVRQLPHADGGKIPAIALTAFARSEDRTRAMIAGYQVHLSKPVEHQELIATVASLAGRTQVPLA